MKEGIENFDVDGVRALRALFHDIGQYRRVLDLLNIYGYKVEMNEILNAEKVIKSCQKAESFLSNPTLRFISLLNDEIEPYILINQLSPFFLSAAKNDRDDLLNNEYFTKLLKTTSSSRDFFAMAAVFSSKKFLLKAKEKNLLTTSDCRYICMLAAANGDIELLNHFNEFLDFDLATEALERSDHLRIERTPLFWAINNHQLNAAEYICTKGANLEQPVSTISKGSYLTLATRTGQHKMVSLLLKFGAKVDQTDALGNTPLCYAADRKDVAIIKMLIEAGADLELKNRYNVRPLDCITDHKVRMEIEEFIVDLKSRSRSKSKLSI